jgi:hypothetical protein
MLGARHGDRRAKPRPRATLPIQSGRDIRQNQSALRPWSRMLLSEALSALNAVAAAAP